MTTATLPLSEAKAQLSALVAQIEGGDIRFIIEKRGVPVAKLVPIAGAASTDVFGSLADFADNKQRQQEQTAMAKAMEAKHASRR